MKEEKCEYRSYSGAELKFDSETAELNYQRRVFKFLRSDLSTIPDDIQRQTSSFLLGLA